MIELIFEGIFYILAEVFGTKIVNNIGLWFFGLLAIVSICVIIYVKSS